MRLSLFIIPFLFFCFACNTEQKETSDQENLEIKTEITFDKTKWMTMDGKDYPYRDQMLNDIVYNDTVRGLTKNEIITLLGEPDRINEGHLYYMITQKRILFWPLKTKTLVIKLFDESTIDWIKIHG